MEIEDLLALLRILGKAQVFRARREAVAYMRKEEVICTGKLLGGKVTVKVEFDYDEMYGPRRAPSSP